MSDISMESPVYSRIRFNYQYTEPGDGISQDCSVTVKGEQAECHAGIMKGFRQFLESMGVVTELEIDGGMGGWSYTFKVLDESSDDIDEGHLLAHDEEEKPDIVLNSTNILTGQKVDSCNFANSLLEGEGK